MIGGYPAPEALIFCKGGDANELHNFIWFDSDRHFSCHFYSYDIQYHFFFDKFFEKEITAPRDQT